MHLKAGFILTTALLLASVAAYAVPRDVDSVESANVLFRNYDAFDIYGGSIRSAVPLYHSQGLWFFTAELRGGRLTQDEGPDFDQVGGELGLTYNMTPVTEIHGAAGYDRYLGTPDFDAVTVRGGIRQALLPNDAYIIPFLRASLSLQFLDPTIASPARQNASYDLSVLEVGGGIVVRTQKTLRWVFEGGRSQSSALDNDGPDLMDGWTLRIAMMYDWF